MVDKEQRVLAAAVLRKLVEGTSTNEDFEREYPSSDGDAAIPAIRANVWMLYSDLREHRLTGKDKPSADDDAILKRCILFLRSELEWEWPVPKIGIRNLIPNALSNLKVLVRGRTTNDHPGGDASVWPFFRREDYERYSNRAGPSE